MTPVDPEDLPSTLKRSPLKAQRTYARTLESAEETYDDPGRARRTAWSAVKHSFEKVGDHWEPKDEPGPSDPQAAHSAPASAAPRETYGGVDARKPKRELYERARELGVDGRSKMDKADLARAIQKANDRATAAARRTRD